jgi:hypothetical protein
MRFLDGVSVASSDICTQNHSATMKSLGQCDSSQIEQRGSYVKSSTAHKASTRASALPTCNNMLTRKWKEKLWIHNARTKLLEVLSSLIFISMRVTRTTALPMACAFCVSGLHN